MERRDFLIAMAGAGSVGPTAAEEPVAISPVDSELAALRRRYVGRFSEPQWAEIRKQLIEHQRVIHAVRGVALTNGDAPIFAPSEAFRWKDAK